MGLPVETKSHLPAIGIQRYRTLALADIERRSTSSGEVIFREGDDARGEAYVVHAGAVEIRKRFDGVERRLNVMPEESCSGRWLFRRRPARPPRSPPPRPTSSCSAATASSG
jgi:hypothetical protein